MSKFEEDELHGIDKRRVAYHWLNQWLEQNGYKALNDHNWSARLPCPEAGVELIQQIQMLFPAHVQAHTYTLLSNNMHLKVRRLYMGKPDVSGTLIWQPDGIQKNYAVSYDLLVALFETWEEFPWKDYFYNIVDDDIKPENQDDEIN